MLPFIDLRGVPSARYQGNATLLSEVETRWDFYRRWSAVFMAVQGLPMITGITYLKTRSYTAMVPVSGIL
jgi:hypothetical protein